MNKHYFQFPLCALSFGTDIKKRLNCIISFRCVELGKKQWQTFNATEKQLRRSDLPSRHTCRSPIDLAKDDHLQVVAGAERLHITIGDIECVLAEHAMLSRFIKEFEAKYGTDAQVRIRADWVFETRSGKYSFSGACQVAVLTGWQPEYNRFMGVSVGDEWFPVLTFRAGGPQIPPPGMLEKISDVWNVLHQEHHSILVDSHTI